ncbi:MAG: superoxide dismutase family protein [Bauldia sp.]|nr:superoxide dismutase family protein [Bauldia sp.]
MRLKLAALSLMGAAALLASPVAAQDTTVLTVPMADPAGASVGTATITIGAHGLVVKLDITGGIAPGAHGVHLHVTGLCLAPPRARPEDPAPFMSAGAHINLGENSHGIFSANGPHAGDLGNIYIPDTGILTAEFLVPGIDAATLLDDNGSAIVIKANADDHTSPPSGGSGDRIACGAILAP